MSVALKPLSNNFSLQQKETKTENYKLSKIQSTSDLLALTMSLSLLHQFSLYRKVGLSFGTGDQESYSETVALKNGRKTSPIIRK